MRKELLIFFATLLALALAVSPALGSPALSVVPGKASYQAGETLSVSGSGAAANKAVSIQLYNPSNVRIAIAQGTSSADGTYSISNIYTFAATDALGTYKVKAYCAGEWAEATFSLVVADTEAPVIVSATLSKSVVKGGASIVVTVQATDNVGVTSVKAGTVSLSLVSGSAASGTWSGSITAVSAEGAASVSIQVSDAAGNSASSSLSYTVDNTAPTITLTAPAEGASFYVSSITVSGTVSDAVSSAAAITLKINNVVTAVASDGTFSKAVTLSEGSNTITVKASDEAGNEATVTRTVSYTVPTGKVDLAVEAGTLYFANEKAVIWVSAAKDGEAVAATLSGHVVLPNGTKVDLTFTSVETGVFKATYDVSEAGTYAVAVSADYLGLKGFAIKSFLVSAGLASIKSDLAAVKADIVAIKGDLVTIKTNIGTLTLNVADLNATVVAIKGDVASVKTTVGDIKGTLTTVNGNVATIVTDVGVIKADVSKLKTDVSGVGSAVSTISTPVWAATILSLIAAIAAIAAVVSIRSKIAG